MSLKQFGGITTETWASYSSNTGNVVSSGWQSGLSGVVSSVGVYSGVSSGNFKFAVYKGGSSLFDATAPKLQTTGALSVDTADDWNIRDIASPFVVASGDWIHLVKGQDSANIRSVFTDPGANSRYSSSYDYSTIGSLPDPFGASWTSPGNYAYGFRFYGYTHPVITSINGGAAINGTDTGIDVVATDLVDSAGDSELWLCDTNNFSIATIKVQQTINSIDDTSIDFDVVPGSLSNGTVYAFVVSALEQVSDPYSITLNLINPTKITYNQMSDYMLYSSLYIPNSWPDSGPSAEQKIDTDLLQKESTLHGIENLTDEIEINEISVNSKLYFNGSDISNFETEGSGDNFVENNYSEFGESIQDRSVFFDEGKYLSNTIIGTYKDDILIEAILKNVSSKNISILQRIVDSTDDVFYIDINDDRSITVHFGVYATGTSITTSAGIVPNEEYFTLSISIYNFDHNVYDSKKIDIYINGELQFSDEFTYVSFLDKDSTKKFSIGYSNSAPDRTSSGYVSYLRLWSRYNWISGNIESTLTDRYNNYKNGGIEKYSQIPISVFLSGDNNGSIPMCLVQDLNRDWNLLGYKTTKKEFAQSQNTFLNGIQSIKLYSKYEKSSYCNFDDLNSFYSRIEKLRIPRKYERVFKRIIAQTKPLYTWAILVVEFY